MEEHASAILTTALTVLGTLMAAVIGALISLWYKVKEKKEQSRADISFGLYNTWEDDVIEMLEINKIKWFLDIEKAEEYFGNNKYFLGVTVNGKNTAHKCKLCVSYVKKGVTTQILYDLGGMSSKKRVMIPLFAILKESNVTFDLSYLSEKKESLRLVNKITLDENKKVVDNVLTLYKSLAKVCGKKKKEKLIDVLTGKKVTYEILDQDNEGYFISSYSGERIKEELGKESSDGKK